MRNRPVDLVERLSQFAERWSPKTVAHLNDYDVKVAKLEGDFVWHSHPETDELFLIIKGELTIEMHEGNVSLREGQMFVVPRDVEHRPRAAGEVHVVLIEPTGVVNPGDAGGLLTATPHDTLR